ncbi:hypothetical protein TCDM_11763 [Trypanosoma cruzi Dm28c]|uniref:Uncharacterized protein n=1 Tax=Trypanosoma cruzi Dm28c TaxID=1416333 RepID=V5B408_TRYCR|nr:hypothetical protein TCDM_11763 [Trypanosoma cruzi Dm28c]
MGSHSPDASRPKLQQTMAAPTRISASMASRNAVEPLERVRQRQLESIAAEEKAYRVALGLFASLASRYYRHLLTPQAALEYLHRQEHRGTPATTRKPCLAHTAVRENRRKQQQHHTASMDGPRCVSGGPLLLLPSS